MYVCTHIMYAKCMYRKQYGVVVVVVVVILLVFCFDFYIWRLLNLVLWPDTMYIYITNIHTYIYMYGNLLNSQMVMMMLMIMKMPPFIGGFNKGHLVKERRCQTGALLRNLPKNAYEPNKNNNKDGILLQ